MLVKYFFVGKMFIEKQVYKVNFINKMKNCCYLTLALAVDNFCPYYTCL